MPVFEAVLAALEARWERVSRICEGAVEVVVQNSRVTGVRIEEWEELVSKTDGLYDEISRKLLKVQETIDEYAFEKIQIMIKKGGVYRVHLTITT